MTKKDLLVTLALMGGGVACLLLGVPALFILPTGHSLGLVMLIICAVYATALTIWLFTATARLWLAQYVDQ